MSTPETIDGTATDIEPTESLALEPVHRPALAVTPNVNAGELVARLAVIQEAMETAMQDGVDYGLIPGVNKPTLLKPGAEKLGVLFQLDIQLVNEKTWGPGDHLTVISHATVFHSPTGTRLGYGEGLCTSREKKYGKRQQDRACPECEAAAIKRSKFPPRENPSAEPGWYCFAKIGGCGANYAADDARLTGQATGEIENPDLPDTWNTVIKMAEKRARVDAVLAVTGASALFTQDAEDTPRPPAAPAAGPPFGDPITPEATPRVMGALGFLLAAPETASEEDVHALWERLAQDADGYFPKVVGRAMLFVAGALKARINEDGADA